MYHNNTLVALVGYAGGFQFTHEKEEGFINEFPSVSFRFGKPDDFMPDDYAQADILIGNFYPRHMEHVKNLKWLQTATSGIDRYKDMVDPQKTIVTNSQGLFLTNAWESIRLP